MSQLINRKKEVAFLSRVFNEGNHLDEYGSAGIGKTTFIKYIEEDFVSKKDYVPIYIGLTENIDFTKLISIISFKIDEIMTPPPFSEFRKYTDSSSPLDEDITVILFRNCFEAAINKKKFLFLFDDTEKISPIVWKEFEEKILRFHLAIEKEEKPQLKIITAGRRRMQWNFFRMKEQVTTCHLDFFDKESTEEMVQQLLSEQQEINLNRINRETFIDDIFSLTLGHPKSIHLIIRHWNDLQVDDEKYQKSIAALLVEKYIQPDFIDQAKILRAGEHYPPSETLLSFLQNLAPLRFISTKVLREILSQLSYVTSFYNKQRAFFFNKLLRTLQEEYLFDWNDDRERYEFPVIVRHILLEDLKYNNLEKLIKLHQETGNIYKKISHEKLEGRHTDFIEQLYHTISWQKLDNAKGEERHDLEETLWSEIDNYLEEYREDTASLKSLLEADDYFNEMMNWNNFFRSL